MAVGDEKRRKSAFMLLGQIENSAWSMAGRLENRVTQIFLPVILGRLRRLPKLLTTKHDRCDLKPVSEILIPILSPLSRLRRSGRHSLNR